MSCNLATSACTLVANVAAQPCADFSPPKGSKESTVNRQVALILWTLAAAPLAAADLVVTNAGDAGTVSTCDGVAACSLRQAINLSNSNGTNDRIFFNIPGGGTHTIQPTTALPAITQGNLNIEGNTQPGAVANSASNGTSNAVLRIVIQGGSAPLGTSGIIVNTSGTVSLRGLSIHGFRVNGSNGGHGVNVQSGSLNLNGCWIGVQPNGAATGNQGDGVRLAGSGTHSIGTSNLANRNVISGNRNGIFVSGGATNVSNNLIGLLPNGNVGGNSLAGVLIAGSGHTLRNNTISANGGFGIDLADNSNENLIVGNRIGSDPSATIGRGNGLGGVRIVGGETGSFGNQIGSAGEPNVIAFNLGHGIALPSGGLNPADGNTLAFNRFFENELFIPEPDRSPSGAGALGIDLGNNGVTANDTGDGDNGPNGLQNFPVVAVANRDTISGQISLSGTFNSSAGSYRLVFHGNRANDPSGHGEAEFLAPESLDITLPASVFQAFNHTISFPGIDASTLVSISATATRLDGSATRATSELSATRAIVAVGPNVFTVTKTADTNDGSCNADCSLREAIVAANGAANAGGLADLIRFNIPGAGPHLLQPASVLPAIDQATIIDGYSQPGSSVNTAADDSHNAQLQIALNLSAGRLLVASGASGSAIRGLNLGGNNAQFLLQVDAANFVFAGNWVGVLAGTAVPTALAISGATPLVGGPLPADRNVFLPTQFGLQLTGGATVRNNLFGILPGGSTAPNPAITHIFCLGPSTATLEVRDNAFRAGRGIECGLPRLYAHTNRFLGEAALLDVGSRHRVVANQVVCTSGTALTVSSTAVESLFADNVLIDCPRAINIGAPFNDPLDADSGPNGQQNHPLLGSATRSGDSVLVNGTLNSNPGAQFRIRFCAIAQTLNGDRGPCDLGEVGTPLVVTTDANGNAAFFVDLPIPAALGATRVSATASRMVAADAEETSEFSPNVVIAANTPPTYLPNTPISRAAGSQGPLPEIIGTAVDAESPGSALTVSQVPGGNASGITLDHFAITGTILNAVVSIACNATSGTTNVQVSDGELTDTDGFLVTVTANTLPSLGYAAVTLAPGASQSVPPQTGPGDNGGAPSLSIQSPGTYAGNVSVAANGTVSLIGATPIGTHTIIVRATDNCGAVHDANLSVTVGDGLFANGYE